MQRVSHYDLKGDEKGSIEFYDKKWASYTKFVDALPFVNIIEREGNNPSYGAGRPLVLFDNRSRVKATPI